MTEEPPQPNAERPDDPVPTPPPDVPAEDAPAVGDAAPSAGDEAGPAEDGPPTADDAPPPPEATLEAPEAETPPASETEDSPASEAETPPASEAEGQPASEAEGERPDPSPPAPTPGEGPSEPVAPAPSGPAGETVSEAPAPADETVPPAADPAPADAAEEAPAIRERPERAPRPRGRRDEDDAPTEEVIPGANLEPDLVLDEPERAEGDEYAAYQQELDGEPVAEEPGDEAPGEPAAAPRSVLDLAADARYRATGKRKTSVARVILRPGTGTYTVNGRTLETFFPRRTLQQVARSPLETAGYTARMDVIAKIHGGGVASQAGALRHGIARALVEADPNLRGELKRAGFLTRDARAKERKKAGLKKARKRPQFSKR